MIASLPLVVVVASCLALVASRAFPRANLAVTRLALSLFGDYVAGQDRRRRERDLMRAAHVGGTHREYASRTLLYAGVLGVAGSVVGVYLAAGFLASLEVGGDGLIERLPVSLSFLAGVTRLTEAGLLELFALLVVASATVGAVLSVGAYYARWTLLSQRATARAAEIDATLPRTVAFVYALSRSGMAFPRVMDTLAENEAVYGEAATELSVAVREMNAFGTDVLTALRHTARRTPSDDLSQFSANLASVLGTGQPLSAFLEDQYERYQEEAESKQEQYLELLSTFAEAYVTTLVAGPLFFITILVVIGLVLEDTLPLLRIVVYVAVPLATFGFAVYVDSITQGIGGTERVQPSETSHGRAGDDGDRDRRTSAGATATAASPRSDGGSVADRWRTSSERLRTYDRFRSVREWANSPVEHVLRSPEAILAVAVPIGVLGVIAAVHPLSIGTLTEVVAQVDAPIVGASAFVLATYAVVYEIKKRRVRRIEAAIPDFLDRLASVNEAGTSVVASIRRVAETDLEALTADLKRTRRDIDWGADVTSALRRLERRVASPMTSRAVVLVTNAIHASGDVAPVLRIAADEARATWTLRRERRQLMLTYLIVIYISFLVFLGVIAALSVSFIPAVEGASVGGATTGSGTGVGTGAGGGLVGGLGDIDTTAYERLFFHSAAIQALCSGIVAGQLGEGSVRDGAKHAALLLVFTLVAFAAMGGL
ncbi:secretion system protein [Halorubrum sp. 48-1-W]|uniref:type II secretion system F family protein n=1 Tax=Halorubrum sp. 48-1-W TaxID=2249761 RepID=UPI000DCDD5D0|nr:type II secretion system F family protein [Halorubrum sp. 48-1-W]RAW45173.1 secretion system protein [Halorubrum sp. 48-1-W]